MTWQGQGRWGASMHQADGQAGRLGPTGILSGPTRSALKRSIRPTVVRLASSVRPRCLPKERLVDSWAAHVIEACGAVTMARGAPVMGILFNYGKSQADTQAERLTCSQLRQEVAGGGQVTPTTPALEDSPGQPPVHLCFSVGSSWRFKNESHASFHN